MVVLLSLVAQSIAQTSETVGENDPARQFTVQIRSFVGAAPATEAQFHCVGSVISRQHILTSASCVINMNSTNLLVAHSTTNRTWVSVIGNHELVDAIYRHPNFNANNLFANNVAILRVTSRLGSH